MSQTLASGTPLQNKWGALGGHRGSMVAPPEKISAFIFGLPGEGKSAFLQSHPDAFIFNLDASSTTAPNPQATLFPGISSTNGQLLDDTGNPISLNYDHVRAKEDILFQLATSNSPRPQTIVYDSLSAWIAMLVQWIPPNAVKLGIASEPKTDWKQLHGPAAWDTLYSLITTTITRLKSAGYGVYVVGHVVNAKIPLEENRFIVKPELTITDGFWKRLYYLFELSALVFAEKVAERYDDIQRSTLNGVARETKVARTREVKKHFLTVAKLELEGLSKARVRLPERIELPLDNGWSAFREAYTLGIKSSS
jgi:hypothetical protein